SAFRTTSRNAGGSRAPRRPAYSTEQRATIRRTSRVVARARRSRSLRCRRDLGADRRGEPMLAAYNGDAYNIVKVLHILCAIVGFGAVTLNGLYGAQAKARGGAEGAAIGQAVYRVSTVGE